MTNSNTNAPLPIQPGVRVSLDNVLPNGTEFSFASTLNITKASALGNIEVICDGGGQATASRQEVQLRREFLGT